MAEESTEKSFEKMTKAEIAEAAGQLAVANGDLLARVAELEAGGAVQQGLINIGSLWGTDQTGKKYTNKNGQRMLIGTISIRVMVSMNSFKQAGTRQPDFRLVAMPFRPVGSGSGEDVFDELEGAQAGADPAEPVPF
jgi:hypothetical protein